MKLWTVQEIIAVTGFSESKVRRAMKAGELESRSVGHSKRVLHSWLIKWLQCDPLLDPDIILSVSKCVQTRGKRTTTTTRIHRKSEPTLFEV